MLGVAGILAQEIVKPGVFFYSAGLPENLPNINFGGPDGKVMLAALTTSQGVSHAILTGEQDLKQCFTLLSLADLGWSHRHSSTLSRHQLWACQQADMACDHVQVNLGGILAWEFLLMHWVEVRRWQDIRKPGSVNEVSQKKHEVTQATYTMANRRACSRSPPTR